MPNDECANLLDLVWLRQRAAWLKTEDLHDVWFAKNMMTAFTRSTKPRAVSSDRKSSKQMLASAVPRRTWSSSCLRTNSIMALFEHAGPRHFALFRGAPCPLLIGASRILDATHHRIRIFRRVHLRQSGAGCL